MSSQVARLAIQAFIQACSNSGSLFLGSGSMLARMKLSDVLTESARQRPRRALPAGDGRNDIVPDDNQCADEQESSYQIEEAYFAKSLGSSKVLRMNGDLEEPTPSSERFDIGSPCRARDEQSAHEEQYSPEQE